MSTSTAGTAPTLGAELERSRLEHRARRIERALLVLRDHRSDVGRDGRRSVALDQAIAGFADELGQVRRRLRDMS